MKKMLFKAIMVIVIMFGLSSYAGYLMTGKLPFSFLNNIAGGLNKQAKEKLGDLKTLDDIKSRKTESGEVLDTGKTKVYKWRDAEGVLHYSSEPPPDDAQATAMNLDPNVNVVPAVKAPEPEVKAEKAREEPAVADGLSNPYTAEGVKEILDKSKNAQKLMQDRAEQQKKILDQL